MNLILVRHGQTEWSLLGRHTSHTDLPLTPRGEENALQLFAPFKRLKPSHVFTSPLKRARKTCDLAGLGGHARVNPSLHEWDYGSYEGRCSDDIRREHPGWEIFRDGCPAGESTAQVAERADHLLEELKLLGGTIILFSHAHFLRVLAMRWLGVSISWGQHFVLDTGTISALGYESADPEVPTLCLWNAEPALDLGRFREAP